MTTLFEHYTNAPETLKRVTPADLPTEIQNKLNDLVPFISEGKSVVLTGTPSIMKEQVAVCILKYCHEVLKRTSSYLETTQVKEYGSDAYMVAFMGIEYTDTYAFKKAMSAIRNHILSGRIAIIGIPSWDILAEPYQWIGSFLATHVVILDIPVTHGQPPEIQ